MLSIGAIGIEATKGVNKAVSEGKNPAHYDMRWAKPLDCEILQQVARTFAHVVTVEDGSLQGGVGSTIENVLRDMGFEGTITRLGIPDQFIEHGTVAELRQMCGIDADSIAAAIK